jgi:hypothetical protein
MSRSGWFKAWRLFIRRRGLRRDLSAVFDDKTPAAEKTACIDRILDSPDGAVRLAALAALRLGEEPLLRDLDDRAPTPEESERLSRTAAGELRALRREGKRFFKPASLLRPAAAAAAVLLAVLVATQLRRPGPAVDTDRSGGPAALETLSPRGDISLREIEFRWSPVRGALHYRLEILDRELTPLYVRDFIPGESHRLPAEVFRRLAPDRLYFWKVTAVLAGENLLESHFEKFRISGI